MLYNLHQAYMSLQFRLYVFLQHCDSQGIQDLLPVLQMQGSLIKMKAHGRFYKIRSLYHNSLMHLHFQLLLVQLYWIL